MRCERRRLESGRYGLGTRRRAAPERVLCLALPRHVLLESLDSLLDSLPRERGQRVEPVEHEDRRDLLLPEVEDVLIQLGIQEIGLSSREQRPRAVPCGGAREQPVDATAARDVRLAKPPVLAVSARQKYVKK